jgi:hypothetical protein
MDEASADPLAGVVGKVNRAQLHLNSLGAELARVDAETKLWGFIARIHRETGKYELRVRRLNPLPMELSLIVGDFVQNLRSALDHLVWQLVIANGRKPKGNSFPIFDERPGPGTREQRSWDKAIKGLSDDMVEFIERCQPYMSDGPHLLMGLRNLSNQDKHRVIVDSHAAVRKPPEGFEFEVRSTQDIGAVSAGKLYVEKALEDGDIVASATVEVTGPEPELQVNANLGLDVAFGDDPWIVPLAALKDMLDSVASVVQLAANAWFDGEPRWPGFD